MTERKFTVGGMTCAACQANVEKCVGRLDGVENVSVNLLTGKMNVSFDDAKLSPADIENAVNAIGYTAAEEKSDSQSDSAKKWDSIREDEKSGVDSGKRRLIISVILLILLMYISMGAMPGLPLPLFLTGEENALINAFTQLLIAVPVLIINKKFFVSGYKALIKRVPNMDSLVALGSSASLLYGIFAIYRMMAAAKTGDTELFHRYAHSLYFESSAMIVTLVSVGKYLESKSKAKTSETLEKLVALAPKTASIIRNGKEVSVKTENIIAGDVVIIRPGDSIPVDGAVISGGGYVDQSTITGESVPVHKREGDEVISATVNKSGSFSFTATRTGDDTTLAQIIRMVDEAGSSKASVARLADKISGIFVPVVMIIAAVTAILWLVIGKNPEFALNCAVSVLVISCPCALGLATPVAIMVGTGKAAELGILIKSAETLEQLHSVDTVVFDKTGTVTEGRPSVTDIITFGADRNKILALAASLEEKSEHPLGRAIYEKALEEKLTLYEAENFESFSGRGIKAVVDGKNCLCGNRAFIEENGIPFNDNNTLERLASSGKTPLIFAADGTVSAIIAVADTVKETSFTAISELQKLGIETVLLTGDNKLNAEAVGRELGISSVISEVLPADKEMVIRSLQENKKNVAMIGDGINDAPALTAADVGIAIGSGTDIAVEAADVVLMKSSLTDAVTAVKLSRTVMKNIRMNLFWAFFYNILGIPLAAGALYPVFGILLSPMIGALAMSLSSLCVVTNALRLRKFKAQKYDTINENKGDISMVKVLKIEGMMCEHCKAHVLKALQSVEGVSSVDVDLNGKTATVELSDDVSDSVLAAAVTEAGYTVIE